MSKAILFNFVVDKAHNSIHVERSFNAPVDLVWAAWTDPEILDLWWAPKPWKAETKSMDFSEGGRWLYAMVGPKGEKHWSVFDFETIHPEKDFSGKDAFCDEHAVIDATMPRTKWKNIFTAQPDETTLVNITLQFETLADLEAIIQMGFKEGFTMGLENLDQYIALRKQKGPDQHPDAGIDG